MGHWYQLNGDSCHTVIGKNGKERGTTLADARKLNLVASVTNIMDIQSKPALINWIQNQVLEAAMASPYAVGIDRDTWKKNIINKSREIGEKAAKRGNEIHDSMEAYFKEGTYDYNEDYTREAINLILKEFPNYFWIAEASFAHKDGFGGRVDLHGYNSAGDTVIIDFKTKDKTDVKDMSQFDDHCIQLAAYQVGLGLPENTRRFNLFISINPETPGLCRLVECEKFDKYKKIFYALLNLWKCKNNYFPEML